jgi:hypothetical protein
MRKNLIICLIASAALLFFGINSVQAGAKIKIGDDSEINLGWRLQTLIVSTESNVDANPADFESSNRVQVRRARFRLGANVGQYVSTFLQTDISSFDVRMIDAFLKLKPHKWFNIIIGQNMAPISRQNLTSSGALLAIDRPAQTYKSLTWGTRAVGSFATATFGDSASGIGTKATQVRDTNVVLFGSGPIPDSDISVKYYLGVGDGINGTGTNEDTERLTGRVQVNIWDPEPGYYNLATYVGKKKTLAIGAGFDTQSDVAFNGVTATNADYTFFTGDVFLEYPLGDGTLTFEGAYQSLDLDDFAPNAEGDGFYAQAGYLFAGTWQPWIFFEQWSSDAPNDLGSYDAIRIGVTYFIKGHNANIKAGYEIFNTDQNITGTTEDSIGTFVVGAYVTY